MTDIVQQGRLIADWVRGLGYATYADDIEALAAKVERQEKALVVIRANGTGIVYRLADRALAAALAAREAGA